MVVRQFTAIAQEKRVGFVARQIDVDSRRIVNVEVLDTIIQEAVFLGKDLCRK